MLLFIVLGVVVVGLIIGALQAAGIIDGSSSVDRLSVGDCVMLPEDMEEVTTLTTTACSNPHDGEVFAIADAGEEDDSYPFLNLDDIAVDACLAAFESYTGVDLFDSDFDIAWLVPTFTSWSGGDRGITCIVTSEDGSPLTGSVAQ